MKQGQSTEKKPGIKSDVGPRQGGRRQRGKGGGVRGRGRRDKRTGKNKVKSRKGAKGKRI